ncbi:MAG TPA: hypothetical protein VGE98_03560 [Thermoanaerobaculia bacterium]
MIERLRAAGLLARRQAPASSWRWLLAASLALLAAGFWIGRWQAQLSSNRRPRPSHILLLHQDASFQWGPGRLALAAEEDRWAIGLQKKAELLTGQALTDDGHLVTPPRTVERLAPGDYVSGFFLLSVGSDERALAIARSCPHLTHGGRVELRKIWAL